MDPRPSRIEYSSSRPNPSLTALSEMTVVAPHPWSVLRLPEQSRDREMLPSRAEAEPVSLPSLKQVFPDVDFTSFRGFDVRSETNGSSAQFMSPSFYASPNKRRRYEDEQDVEAARGRSVPRVYRGPRHRVPNSPRQSPSAPRSSDRWPPAHETTVSPNSSYAFPAPMAVQDMPRPRIALPSLRTTMNFENESQNSLESSQGSSREYGRAYSQDYTNYHTQSHYQSQPSSPGRPYDRASFSAGTYHNPHYVETNHSHPYGELGAMAGESKQRKRRGNLPKETTDKLRSWFISHLQHPYPTEDEKQELVRQTGLQMNQISNWFINARRRQLPAMLKNERGETDATGRGISSREGKSTDPSSIASSPISEAEAHSSDEILQRHRRGSFKRGSV
ncbi:hypothetical protein V8C35DRAFT_28169 [Trichoderma chlorosporum]